MVFHLRSKTLLEKIMQNLKTLAALVATALLSVTAIASAQTVTGGGASLPAKLYKGEADSILPSNFTYASTGSGTGRTAFLTNDSSLFPGASGTVHYAGSDSVLTAAQINTYNATYNVAGDANRYGPLIQIPSVGTSVTIPYNNGNANLNLTDAQLCGIFSGRITNWSSISSSRTGAIRVVYRTGSSGTTELLTRFLSTVCAAETTANFPGYTSKLVNNSFATTSTFTSLFKAGALPSTWVPAALSEELYASVYATANAVGYVGPDMIPSLTDATKVARLRGFSPSEVSVQATLDTVAPPTGAAAADPLNWVPVFTNPSTGYPIAGYTNFFLGQCYKNAAVATSLRTTLQKHYTGGNDTAIRAHGFIPLTSTWRTAVLQRFVLQSNAAAINNVSTCGTIGQPGNIGRP